MNLRRFLICHRRAFFLASIGFALLAMCLSMNACAAPNWLTDAEAILPVLASSVTSVLSFLAAMTGNAALAAALAAIQPIIQDVGSSLGDLQSLIEQYQTSPNATLVEKIEEVAGLINTNLSKLVGDLGLPANVASIVQQWAQLVLSQLDAWLGIIPQIKSAIEAETLHALPKAEKIMTASEIKQAFNALLDQKTGDAETDAALAKAPRLT